MGIIKQATILTMGVPKLPNDIIMKIIKEADGGRVAHSAKFKKSLQFIDSYSQLKWDVDWVNDWCIFSGTPPFFQLLIHARRTKRVGQTHTRSHPNDWIKLTAPTALAILNNWEKWQATKQYWMDEEVLEEEDFDYDFK